MRSLVSKKNQAGEEEAEVTSQFAALLCNQLLEKSPNSIQEFIRAPTFSIMIYLYLRTYSQKHSITIIYLYHL